MDTKEHPPGWPFTTVQEVDAFMSVWDKMHPPPWPDTPSDWIKKFRYKPDVTLDLVYDYQLGMVRLTIDVHCIDTRFRDAPNPPHGLVGHPYSMSINLLHERPYEDAKRLFKAWVRNCIHQTEDHEADEWLLYDGEQLNNPHAKDAFRDR